MSKNDRWFAVMGIGIFFLLVAVITFSIFQKRLNSDPLLSAEEVIDNNKQEIKTSANAIYESIVKYGQNHDKTKGILFDFAKDKSDNEVISGKELVYEGIKASSGKLFLSPNGDIQVVENLKIGDYYCIKDSVFICNSDIRKDTNVIKYQDWLAGSIVTLKDGSKWQVIKNDMKYLEEITLASLNLLDFNNDQKLDENDMLEYDMTGKLKFDFESQSNIAAKLKQYYNVQSDLKVDEIRFLTEDEINKYSQLKTGLFWLDKTSGENVAVWKDNKIDYQKPTSNAYVRPVIVISKRQIK